MPTLLDANLIEETLQALPGWHGSPAALWRDIRLAAPDVQALTYQVAVDSTAMGHHPDVRRIADGTRFVLRTRDAGGVTELDVALASHISDLAHRISRHEPGVVALRDDSVHVTDRVPTARS